MESTEKEDLHMERAREREREEKLMMSLDEDDDGGVKKRKSQKSIAVSLLRILFFPLCPALHSPWPR
jgi:hypothetical protein